MTHSDTLWATEPAERLAEEMAIAWRRGERPPAEFYLNQHPELFDLPEAAVRVIYEEACLRQERGEDVAAEEFARRFPRWADELAVLLDCHGLMQGRFSTPAFPLVGDSLGDFRLTAELGRGSLGRVFLATQPALADRPVVLKVTPRRDREFLSLARLQHTHVIPLYGVYDFPAKNLRALCQPYFGGATLGRLLDVLGPEPADARTGTTLVAALDSCANRALPPASTGAGPRKALARAEYTESIAWIGACLADALQYAHERGVIHLDIKPSNVLIAADGQPLLLDFHLAIHPLAAGAAGPAEMGGTLGYMSPEQEAAYDAALDGRPLPMAVDHRSDIYSLGRLLHVALAGRPPGDDTPLRRANPRVSVGLADIVAHCLAADPADRYPDAAALAADLRRHVANEPLRGVRNRSIAERWHKWHRRRPHAVLWTGLILALLGVPVAVGAAALERRLAQPEPPRAFSQDAAYWAYFDIGTNAYNSGRYADAAYSFGVAATIAPERAEIYHNRALAHTAAGDLAAARSDYDRALTLTPSLSAASLNRGVLNSREGRFTEALDDLEQALKCGADPTAVHYNLALVHRALGNLAAALQDLDRVLADSPDHVDAKLLREQITRSK